MENKIEDYALECSDDLFRYFIRKNYESVKLDNEECDDLKGRFVEHLKGLGLTEHQKKNVLPKNEADVILNTDHPLRIHGFPAAYLHHFTTFVEKMKKAQE